MTEGIRPTKLNIKLIYSNKGRIFTEMEEIFYYTGCNLDCNRDCSLGCNLCCNSTVFVCTIASEMKEGIHANANDIRLFV
jgi:hypothetical protein